MNVRGGDGLVREVILSVRSDARRGGSFNVVVVVLALPPIEKMPYIA